MENKNQNQKNSEQTEREQKNLKTEEWIDSYTMSIYLEELRELDEEYAKRKAALEEEYAKGRAALDRKRIATRKIMRVKAGIEKLSLYKDLGLMLTLSPLSGLNGQNE